MEISYLFFDIYEIAVRVPNVMFILCLVSDVIFRRHVPDTILHAYL